MEKPDHDPIFTNQPKLAYINSAMLARFVPVTG